MPASPLEQLVTSVGKLLRGVLRYETARLNWLNRDKKQQHDTYAVKLTKELNKKAENPFDDL